MGEDDIDLSNRTPQAVSEAELESCDYVATMGCSTLDLEADTDVRDWDLPDPHGEDLETAHSIREDVRARVADLFDELEAESA